MKEEIGVADEMTLSVLGLRARSARAIAREARTASFASTVTLLEATESNDNRHEGEDGHC